MQSDKSPHAASSLTYRGRVPNSRKRSDSKLKRCNGEERTKSSVIYEDLFTIEVRDLFQITYL